MSAIGCRLQVLTEQLKSAAARQPRTEKVSEEGTVDGSGAEYIYGELCELSLKAAGSEAMTLDHLAAKAKLLMILSDGLPDDMVGNLVKSLCADILQKQRSGYELKS
jgi:hypothetical protein